MGRVLIVDEENAFKELASSWLRAEGHEVVNESDSDEGLKILDTFKPEVVVLDVSTYYLVRAGFVDTLIRQYTSNPARRVIITAVLIEYLPVPSIEKFMKLGAFNVLQKPLNLEGHFNEREQLRLEIVAAVSQAITSVKSVSSLDDNFKRKNIIGHSDAIISCLLTVKKAAPTSQPILITGETGTGKELFARAAHENSQRRKGPFVPINCASIPRNMIESELFGYKAGAFTDAKHDKIGIVKQADGGTLFLDEIGELSTQAQANLLRCFEEKAFRPLGADSKKEEHSDFRLVSATNQDLEQNIAKGQFRSDLYSRINTFIVHLPPLRDRREDVKHIAAHFIKKACKDEKVKPKKWTREFMDALEMGEFKDNVRGLRNIIHAALAEAGDAEILDSHHLPRDIFTSWAAARLHTTVEPSQEERVQIMQWNDERRASHASIDKESGKQSAEQSKNKVNENLSIKEHFERSGSKHFYSLSTQSLPSNLPANSEPAEEITPENIVAGKTKWALLKSLPHEKRIAIMIAAEALWKKKGKGKRKELAKAIEVSEDHKKCKDNLDRFFSSARMNIKKGKHTIEALKNQVSEEHHPALEVFVRKVLGR